MIGKPNLSRFQMDLAWLGVPSDGPPVGDRPDTDIAGVEYPGLGKHLVRAGRFASETPWPTDRPQPDPDVLDLVDLMAESGFVVSQHLSISIYAVTNI